MGTTELFHHDHAVLLCHEHEESVARMAFREKADERSNFPR
jgi:hypothetical protein